MTKKEDAFVVKKTSNSNWSRQVEWERWFTDLDWVLASPDFKGLEKLYEDSFLVSWILDKIQSSVWRNLQTEDKDLENILQNIDHTFLNESQELMWNTFFEIIREKHWNKKIKRLVPIIASTIRKLKKWGYIQVIGTQKVYFNEFTKKEDRDKKIKIWEASWVWLKELSVEKEAWYNPNLNEVYQFKRSNLINKHYWKSLYIPAIDQILLLSQIDKFFTTMFDRGWMNNSIIFVKHNWQVKTQLSTSGQKILQDFLKDNFNGVKNANSHAFVQAELWKLDLSDKVDVNAFIEKTFELVKKISMALNIPYEVLLTIMWNKSTSVQAEENFIKHKIEPLQAINIRCFKELFEDDYAVDDLSYIEIDTQNPLDKMKVLTWYSNAGIMTANEIRKTLKLEELEWWDELKVNNNNKIEEEKEEEIEKQFKDLASQIKKIYE